MIELLLIAGTEIIKSILCETVGEAYDKGFLAEISNECTTFTVERIS